MHHDVLHLYSLFSAGRHVLPVTIAQSRVNAGNTVFVNISACQSFIIISAKLLHDVVVHPWCCRQVPDSSGVLVCSGIVALIRKSSLHACFASCISSQNQLYTCIKLQRSLVKQSKTSCSDCSCKPSIYQCAATSINEVQKSKNTRCSHEVCSRSEALVSHHKSALRCNRFKIP